MSSSYDTLIAAAMANGVSGPLIVGAITPGIAVTGTLAAGGQAETQRSEPDPAQRLREDMLIARAGGLPQSVEALDALVEAMASPIDAGRFTPLVEAMIRERAARCDIDMGRCEAETMQGACERALARSAQLIARTFLRAGTTPHAVWVEEPRIEVQMRRGHARARVLGSLAIVPQDGLEALARQAPGDCEWREVAVENLQPTPLDKALHEKRLRDWERAKMGVTQGCAALAAEEKKS